MASPTSHNPHSCGICRIENLFYPPLPPRPNPNSLSTTNTSVTSPSSLSSSSSPFSSSSYANSHDDSTPLSFPISMSSLEGSGKDKTTLVEKDKDGMKKKVLEDATKRWKAWPPPITLLRNLQIGKPYAFVRYDEESKQQVVDEIKIPEGDLFYAEREDGILKLFIKNFLEKEEE